MVPWVTHPGGGRDAAQNLEVLTPSLPICYDANDDICSFNGSCMGVDSGLVFWKVCRLLRSRKERGARTD